MFIKNLPEQVDCILHYFFQCRLATTFIVFGVNLIPPSWTSIHLVLKDKEVIANFLEDHILVFCLAPLVSKGAKI